MSNVLPPRDRTFERCEPLGIPTELSHGDPPVMLGDVDETDLDTVVDTGVTIEQARAKTPEGLRGAIIEAAVACYEDRHTENPPLGMLYDAVEAYHRHLRLKA